MAKGSTPTGCSGWMDPTCLVSCSRGKRKRTPPGWRHSTDASQEEPETVQKEMSTVRNMWFIWYLNLSSAFNRMFGSYLYLLTQKPTMLATRQGHLHDLTALPMLFSMSRSLRECDIWQRPWAAFTRVHISSVFISIIISFLFTTTLWQQGTTRIRKETPA